MEAKLIKVEDVYRLLREDNLIIGTTDYEYQKAFSDHCYKLSLRNCQAIESGYDLDELAFQSSISDVKEHSDMYRYLAMRFFKEGFQKALEILGDKKFSEDDIKQTLYLKTGFDKDGFYFYKSDEEIIQSLQQTEWDCIVEMEDIQEIHVDGVLTLQPKLDAENCLILKRL